MNISVVIATYNGEKYILEQLQSLLQQSRKADEVIIIDDKSSDSTPILILEFIEKNNLCGSWSLFVNEQNLGWKKILWKDLKEQVGILFSHVIKMTYGIVKKLKK